VSDARPSSTRAALVTPPAEAESDIILVRRYLNGDERAFEVLFKKYQTPIFNLVSRMVGGEDAVLSAEVDV
jgi:hypothetical protein